MTRPTPYGWFHLLFMAATLTSVFLLVRYVRRPGNRQLDTVLLAYAVPALLLEVVKQVIWSLDYDAAANIASWDYQWYAAPFQLCTMPAYICLIAVFLKPGKTKDALLSFLAYFTILGSITVFFIPGNCFVPTIEVNIHSMWLHCGSLVISLFLLMSGTVDIDFRSVRRGFVVFLICAGTALAMDLIVVNTGIAGGDTFNMFYISPYFISSLPVFDTIQQSVPYPVFLATYIAVMFAGGTLVFGAAFWIKRLLARGRSIRRPANVTGPGTPRP